MTQAHSVILSELVSCTLSTIPICPFLIQRIFHLLVILYTSMYTMCLIAPDNIIIMTFYIIELSVSMKTPLVLLCLLWSLVEVHSQTAPYVSFMGETLPNHVYVNLSLVGNDYNGGDSVQCHTDLSTCCTGVQGIHSGDWFAPGSETRVLFPNVSNVDIYEVRGHQRVDLRRRNNADMPSGIYRCQIPTNTVHNDNDIFSVRESVYVGLYDSGGNQDIHQHEICCCLINCAINSTYI